MKKIMASLLLFFLLSQVGIAQDFDRAKLDRYLDTLEAHHKFMGSIAISKGDHIIYARSLGYATLNPPTKADKATKYRIGSISKTFTAVLVLKAVEQGKLKLDQTIHSYFPSIENAKKITVEQLLRHRSGIHNFTDDKDYLTWNTEPKTRKEMISTIAKGGSDFEPGTRFEYSNSNYVLLTYILEDAFKKPYAKLLKNYITDPLGLKNTYLGGKINPKKGEAESYKYLGKWVLQPETDPSIPLGAGGIVSTPVDLVSFSNALFNGKLLTAESLKKMKTMVDGYGMGLFTIPFYDHTGYGHTGGIDGFTSVFSHSSDGNISYALTSNGTDFNNNDISIAALSAVYGKPFDLPDISGYQVTAADLDKYIGGYTSKEIPLKISITKKGNTLIAQGSGQPAFALEAVSENKFKFDQAGVVIVFNPENQSFLLKQGGQSFTFTKEKGN